MTCKVADFGLSRGATKVSEGDDGYYKSTNGVFPLRWTAPESMQSLRFSTASDVWSFAIVLVEVMQHGRIPYAGMSNREVILDVMKGYRIKQEQLGGCSTSLYIALMKCWKIKPEERPNFTELIANFEDLKEGKTLNGSVEVKEEALPEGYGGPSGDISESTYYDADGSATALANDAANASAATGNSHVPVSTPPSVDGDESDFSSYHKRVIAVTAENDSDKSPLTGLENTPLTTLSDAVTHAAQHNPGIDRVDGCECRTTSMMSALQSSLKFARHLVDRGKSLGLNVDQAAALHFYSQEFLEGECPFYCSLNGALGGWGCEGHTPAHYYLPYIKLALGAIDVLPSEDGLVVYRGVRGVALAELLCGKVIGDTLTWWAFTSTTSDDDVLRDEAFLGSGEGLEARTVFKITTKTGVRIKNFSNFGADSDYYMHPVDKYGKIQGGQNEEEILLSPGTTFIIDDIISYPNNITEVTMHEIVQSSEVTVHETYRKGGVPFHTGTAEAHADLSSANTLVYLTSLQAISTDPAVPEGYGGPSGDISESAYYDADGSATALANDAVNATGDSYTSYVPVSTPPGSGGEKGPANPEPAYVGADGDLSGYVPLSTTQANRKRTETVYRTAKDAAAEMTTVAGGSERFSSGGSNDAAVYHTAEQATADQGYIGVSGAIDANGNPCTDCATEPNNYEYMSKEQVRRASQTADEFNDVIAESNLDCTPEDGYLSPAVLPVPELGSRKSQKKSSKGKMSKAADAAIKVDEAGYVEGSAIPEILAAGKAPPLPTTKKQTFGF